MHPLALTRLLTSPPGSRLLVVSPCHNTALLYVFFSLPFRTMKRKAVAQEISLSLDDLMGPDNSEDILIE